MIDGLWTVEFEGVPNFLGGGVVFLFKNHLYGGDSQYFYVGLYDVKDGNVSAMVQVSSFVPAPETVFGTKERQFSIQLTGTLRDKQISGIAIRPDNPALRIRATLTKRSELP